MFGLTWEKIASAVQGKLHTSASGKLSKPTGACIDTRNLQQGDLFFALKGENTDGHRFLKEAREKGAVGAVVNYIPSDVTFTDFPLLVVEDTVKALQQLAAAQRQIFTGAVIAVTGSTGKTSTKEMVAAILQEKGPVLKTMENHNNELGLPLSLLAVKQEHRFVVVEMGMRGLGEIDFLCRISQPDYGVITNIGHTHQELLGSQEKIAQAKAELIAHLPARGGIVLPAASKNILRPWLSNIRCATLWFGLNGSADICALEPRLLGEKGIDFDLVYRREAVGEIHLPLPGRHNILNALAAAGIGKHLGLTWAEICAGLAKVTLPKMRLEFEQIKSKDVQVINDAYNANPDSMCSALEVLQEAAVGKRAIAVLGDMYELGDFTEEGHLFVGRLVKEKGLAYLITVGKLGEIIARGAEAAGMNPERVHRCLNNEEAFFYLQEIMQSGDVILVKGSRGVKMEEIIVRLVSS
ncbi:MAG: UDP-N-acetylmuramoyl-tripeptide--D-alanyl-D-alanine ligase [Peptococcia bacterium]|jgi:UDP-N-acetylmuramoyl-tripeptide--D-alanyl-D-alanine ligase